MKPFFSVIVPTYNRIERLLPTLNSILKQDFENFELLIVDDGSTDGTEERITKNYADNPQVIYFYKKNEERSVARNFGFQKSKGEYVVFFDSDDFMHSNHLSSLKSKIDLHPNCNFFTTKFQFKKDKKISPSHIQNWKEGFYDYKNLLEGSWFGTLVCVKKNNPKIHLFPPQFNIAEDWIFNLSNLKKDKIFVIDSSTITVYDHDERSMAANQKVIQGRLAAMNYVLEELEFTPSEQKILKGHSYYFCAVHAYLDKNRQQGITFLWATIKTIGLSLRSLILFAKLLVGKSRIEKLRH